VALRAVSLGIGHWHALWHVGALRRLGHAVVGVWDHDGGRAARLAREIGCPAFPTVEAALAGAHPDLAVVSPRPIEAPAVMRAVLEAGVPLLAEKPLGLRADDVRPLAGLARRLGVYAAVLFVNRLSPLWDALGEAGDRRLVTAQFRINNGPLRRYPAAGVGWMTDPRQAGGGCLRNLGIHGADAVVQLAGDSALEVVAARTSTLEPGLEVETYALAVLRFGQGSVAVIEAGYNFPADVGGDYEWRVSTPARYLVDQEARLLVGDPSGWRELPTPSSAERYQRFVFLSLERLRAGQPPIADIEDCCRAARVIDAIYAASGTPAQM
jgi:predicted dehydrogenase